MPLRTARWTLRTNKVVRNDHIGRRAETQGVVCCVNIAYFLRALANSRGSARRLTCAFGSHSRLQGHELESGSHQGRGVYHGNYLLVFGLGSRMPPPGIRTNWQKATSQGTADQLLVDSVSELGRK